MLKYDIYLDFVDTKVNQNPSIFISVLSKNKILMPIKGHNSVEN